MKMTLIVVGMCLMSSVSMAADQFKCVVSEGGKLSGSKLVSIEDGLAEAEVSGTNFGCRGTVMVSKSGSIVTVEVTTQSGEKVSNMNVQTKPKAKSILYYGKNSACACGTN